MNYIVLDLEWNPCPSGKGKENTLLPFEIIEIGAIKLDAECMPIDQFNEMIKPAVYNEVHYKIHELTNIDAEKLNTCRSFTDVFSEFLKWCGEDYWFCTWGHTDLKELLRNMKYFGIQSITKGPLRYYDIQKLYSIAYEDGKIRRTLEYASDALEIEKLEPFHRAMADAHYTTAIIQKMDFDLYKQYFSIDCYYHPRTKKEEIHVTFDSYAKFISREFRKKVEALADNEVTSTKCYKCGKTAAVKINWFSDNSKLYYSLSYCEKHGYLKGKLRMKKAENGNVYVVKTLKLTNVVGAADIMYRQEEIRLKRKNKRHRRMLSRLKSDTT